MQARRHFYLATLIALLATQTAWAQNQGRQGRQPVIRRVFKPQAAGTQLPASWTITGNQYVSQSEYHDLRNGCMELLRRYPPDKYFFVGLGRDPAPVIAFLQNLGEKNLAVNLPGTSNIGCIGWKGSVNPGDQVVAQHIEAAIPEHILKGERQIVILDVTSTGKTPATFGPYLDTYLQARGNHKPVIRLAFSWSAQKGQTQYGHLTVPDPAGHRRAPEPRHGAGAGSAHADQPRLHVVPPGGPRPHGAGPRAGRLHQDAQPQRSGREAGPPPAAAEALAAQAGLQAQRAARGRQHRRPLHPEEQDQGA
jgi:hypothetical protein